MQTYEKGRVDNVDMEIGECLPKLGFKMASSNKISIPKYLQIGSELWTDLDTTFSNSFFLRLFVTARVTGDIIDREPNRKEVTFDEHKNSNMALLVCRLAFSPPLRAHFHLSLSFTLYPWAACVSEQSSTQY